MNIVQKITREVCPDLCLVDSCSQRGEVYLFNVSLVSYNALKRCGKTLAGVLANSFKFRDGVENLPENVRSKICKELGLGFHAEVIHVDGFGAGKVALEAAIRKCVRYDISFIEIKGMSQGGILECMSCVTKGWHVALNPTINRKGYDGINHATFNVIFVADLTKSICGTGGGDGSYYVLSVRITRYVPGGGD